VQAAATLAVKVCPAIVAVHVCAAPEFGATVTVTLPGPIPDTGVTVSAGSFAEAVQVSGAQPTGAAVTLTTCEPPAAPNDMAAGARVNVQTASTLSVCVADSVPTLAVTSARPLAIAVATPAATVSFEVSDEDHCAAAVRSSLLPSESVARAVQRACCPMEVSAVASQVTASADGVGAGRVGLHPKSPAVSSAPIAAEPLRALREFMDLPARESNRLPAEDR
jgi:hypothetical protein